MTIKQLIDYCEDEAHGLYYYYTKQLHDVSMPLEEIEDFFRGMETYFNSIEE